MSSELAMLPVASMTNMPFVNYSHYAAEKNIQFMCVLFVIVHLFNQSSYADYASGRCRCLLRREKIYLRYENIMGAIKEILYSAILDSSRGESSSTIISWLVLSLVR